MDTLDHSSWDRTPFPRPEARRLVIAVFGDMTGQLSGSAFELYGSNEVVTVEVQPHHVVSLEPGLKPMCRSVIADHRQPGKCFCPLDQPKPRIDGISSDAAVHDCANEPRQRDPRRVDELDLEVRRDEAIPSASA